MRRHALSTTERQTGLEAIQKTRWVARVVPSKTQIFLEGEPSSEIFAIVSGWAFRYKVLSDGRRQILNFLAPNDLFGLSGQLLESQVYSVESITEVSLRVFKKAELTRLCCTSPAVAFLLYQIMASQKIAAFEHLVDLGRRSAREAVCHLLLELCLRQRPIETSTDCSCIFPMTQDLLADALGLTPVHVNRVLRRLRDDGLVDITSHKLIVNDVDDLARLCEFSRDYTTGVLLI
jgi:CRP-like cAMP-binding protein